MNLFTPIFTFEYLIKGAITRLKRLYFYQKFKIVGKNVRIHTKSTFYWPEKIEFSNNVFVEEGAHFSCREGLKIGNYVMIGPNITIIGGDHKFEETDQPMWSYSKGIDNTIVIEDDVWIGANVTLLKNAHISKGCVIGACSVVVKKTEPYGVYVGNPARLIKYRKRAFLK